MKTVNCQIKVKFQAPLRFVYSWCTDYSPKDPKILKEAYERRVIQRTPRRVIFEELSEMKDGWRWNRAVVSLRPPNKWYQDSVGNYRDLHADYKLTSPKPDRTELSLRWRVRPKSPASAKLTKTMREKSAASMWRKYAKALVRDYRKTPKTSRRN